MLLNALLHIKTLKKYGWWTRWTTEINVILQKIVLKIVYKSNAKQIIQQKVSYVIYPGQSAISEKYNICKYHH